MLIFAFGAAILCVLLVLAALCSLWLRDVVSDDPDRACAADRLGLPPGRIVFRKGKWQAKRFRVRLHFVLRDMWVGAYWQRDDCGTHFSTMLWVCLLPCLPIRFEWLSTKGANKTCN